MRPELSIQNLCLWKEKKKYYQLDQNVNIKFELFDLLFEIENTALSSNQIYIYKAMSINYIGVKV